ncbi:MAG TPA: sugar transferase [Fimbriiglobus sp.]|jgi:lipopolysaccharide/colanic/teichoic acid biosynthesis glycosyltransferase
MPNPFATVDRPEGRPCWTLSESLRYACKKHARFLTKLCRRSLKRGLDIVVATAFLVGLSPLFAVVGILIKLNDGGPILFWQKRVGRWGRTFSFPKFRSMVINAENLLPEVLAQNHHKTGVTYKSKADPRITWVGKIIRRTSIDELPQLWCVLIGDMTLVGPRPALPREVVKYSLEDRRRLDVIPGLTCIWQISGRGELPFERQVELDVDYIERQTSLLDFKILFLTLPAVVKGRGAY